MRSLQKNFTNCSKQGGESVYREKVKKNCKIGIVGHPLLPQGGDKVAAQQLVKVAMMYVVSGHVRISGKCELFMKNGQKAVMV